MRYKTANPDIQLEDTGQIRVYNYPAEKGTFSYLSKVYREYDRNKLGWEETEGKPIYFHDLSGEYLALAKIMGEAQNILAKIPRNF